MTTVRLAELEVLPELDAFFELAAFFELDFLPAAFCGAAALRDGDFARETDFLDVFFFDLPTFDLPVALREAVFFAVTFLRDTFFAAGFAAGLRAVFFEDRAAVFRATVFFDDFLRAAVLLFDVAFTPDFALDFWGLTFRLLPVVFLLAADLRGAAFFLLVPALLRFLLAALFAGMRTPAGAEKNAELYIACLNMEAPKNRGFAAFTGPAAGAWLTAPEPLAGSAGKRSFRRRDPLRKRVRRSRGGASLSPAGDIVLSAELL